MPTTLEPLAWTLLAVIGLLVGSFLNVVIHRLPRHESIVFPGSHCPLCGHELRPWDNIPVLSWLSLRGRCRYCQGAISGRYPLVEIVAALLAILAAWVIGWHGQLLPALILLWALLALTLIDLETYLLPDRITKSGMVLGLLINASAFLTQDFALTRPLDALLGLVLGYGLLRGLAEIYLRLSGREGMGHGDFKLLGMIGAWLGWQDMFLALFLAALSGGLVAIVFLASGKGRDYAIPFGPYLALGAATMLLWPQVVIEQFLHLAAP
ncbi:A24 family peptidase [Acidithiobacillus sp. IBUN Pt1247-S3]|uniref:prepilin peptidase n=1 Tax=Acidithiobacillus sp. IBUN Pt1247-S3 TaxID=3166642 RepID=UPI0034E5C401